MEGGVRRLTLKNCQVDQAGEVSYQALNAVTSAMLNVKGKKTSWFPPDRHFRRSAGQIKVYGLWETKYSFMAPQSRP